MLSTLGLTSNLKSLNQSEKLTKDKHFNLLLILVYYDLKKLHNIGPSEAFGFTCKC
jgi:hypothetical protein